MNVESAVESAEIPFYNDFINGLRRLYDAKFRNDGDSLFGLLLLVCLSERYCARRLRPIPRSSQTDLNVEDTSRSLQKEKYRITVEFFKDAKSIFSETEFSKHDNMLKEAISKVRIYEDNLVKYVMTPLRTLSTKRFDEKHDDVYDTGDFFDKCFTDSGNVRRGVDGIVKFGDLSVGISKYTNPIVPVVLKLSSGDGRNIYNLRRSEIFKLRSELCLDDILNLFTNVEFEYLLKTAKNTNNVVAPYDLHALGTQIYRVSKVCSNLKDTYVNTLKMYAEYLKGQSAETVHIIDENSVMASLNIRAVFVNQFIKKIRENKVHEDTYESTITTVNRQIITEYVVGKFCINETPDYEKYFPTFYTITWNTKAERNHDTLNMVGICDKVKQEASAPMLPDSRNIANTIMRTLDIESDSYNVFKKSYVNADILAALKHNGSFNDNIPVNRDCTPKIVMSNIDFALGDRPDRLKKYVPAGDEQSDNSDSLNIHGSVHIRDRIKHFFKSRHTASSKRYAACFLLDCITQLTDALRLPQRKNNFLHNDLHLSNVKVVESPDAVLNVIKFSENYVYTSRRSFKIYDFGRSTARFGDILVGDGDVFGELSPSLDVVSPNTTGDATYNFVLSVLQENPKVDANVKNVAEKVKVDIRKQILEELAFFKLAKDMSKTPIPPPPPLLHHHRFFVTNGSIDIRMKMSEIPNTDKVNNASKYRNTDLHFGEYWDIYMLLSSILLISMARYIREWAKTDDPMSGEISNALYNMARRISMDEKWYDITHVYSEMEFGTNSSLSLSIVFAKIVFHFLAMAVSVSENDSKGSTNYRKRHYDKAVESWFACFNGDNFNKIYHDSQYKILVQGGSRITLSTIARLAINLRCGANFYDVKSSVVSIVKMDAVFLGRTIDDYFNDRSNDNAIKKPQNRIPTRDESTEGYRVFNKTLLGNPNNSISEKIDEKSAYEEAFVLYDAKTKIPNDVAMYPAEKYTYPKKWDDFFSQNELAYLTDASINPNAVNTTLKMLPGIESNDIELSYGAIYLSAYAKNMHDPCYALCVNANKHLSCLKKISELLLLFTQSENFSARDPSTMLTFVEKELDFYGKISKYHHDYVCKVCDIATALKTIFQPSQERLQKLKKTSESGGSVPKMKPESFFFHSVPIYFMTYALSLYTLCLNLTALCVKEYEKIIYMLESLKRY